jgi:uncharacterized protein YndB with AHSA1/START domain
MSTIEVSRPMTASREAVWGVLADFANIADWNGGVTESFSTSEAADGLGAQRHCDLKPFGGLEETIRGWEPMREIVISIDSAAKLPIKTGLVTFTIDGDDAGPTVNVHYDYAPKFGPIGKLMTPLLDRQLTTGFGGFLDDLDAEAVKRSAAVG